MESRLLALSRFFSRMPRMVRRLRWFVLLSITVISVVLAWGAWTRTSLDMTVDSFIDPRDPAIQALNEFRSQFGSDDSVFLVYRAKDGDIFSAQSLHAVQALTGRLQNWRDIDPASLPAQINNVRVDVSELSHIRRVQSPTTLRLQQSEGDMLRSVRLVPQVIPEQAEALKQIREQALDRDDFRLAFYSADGRYGALLIQTNFGAEPEDGYIPAIDQAAAGLSDSFSAFDDNDSFDLSFDESASIEDIPFQTVDMSDYSRFFTAVRAVYSDYEDVLEFYPVGNPPLMDWVFQALQQMLWLGAGMVAIFVLLLWSLFRSFSAVLWPVVTIALSLLWTWGIMAWAGVTLSTLITLTCMLIFAVGIADCVHVLSAYFSLRNKGSDHDQALAGAYDKTGLAILITTVTTMSGLLALTWSDLIPIRVFGVMSALGVFMALFFTVVLLPLLLDAWRPVRRPHHSRPISAALLFWQSLSRSAKVLFFAALTSLLFFSMGWAIGLYLSAILLLSAVVIRFQNDILQACPAIVARSPMTVLGLFLGIFAASLYGTSLVQIDSNISELTREGSEPRVAYQAVDDNMAGAQTLSIMIDSGSSEGMMQPAMLQTVDRLQEHILARYPEQVSRTHSLANIVKDTNQIMNRDDPAYYRIPDSEVMVAQLLYLFNSANPVERRSLVSDDYSRSHITINAYNAGSYQYQQFFQELNEDIDNMFAPLSRDFPNLDIEVTGSIPLMMRAMDEIAQSQYRSFLLALAVISVIMILTLGSFQAGITAMIPNLIPPMLAFGLMGLLGMPLDTDTLLIAPVIIGIAVDDTIHFMTHYRLALARTRSMEQALRSTISTVGRAVMFTTMILGLGFAILSFSDYLGIAKIGFFGSLAIFIALLCDLFLLPALIMIFKPRFGMKGIDSRFRLQGEPA